MKTLVIHPDDPTTDFLKEVYSEIECVVLTKLDYTDTCRRDLIEAIKSHDRVIFLGHGTGAGLLTARGDSHVINSRLVYLLREKAEMVYVWCYANKFVKSYNLTGFATGMFISEVEEAWDNNITPTPNEIPNSNKLFAQALKACVSAGIPVNEYKELVRKLYNSDISEIINFNWLNLGYYAGRDDQGN